MPENTEDTVVTLPTKDQASEAYAAHTASCSVCHDIAGGHDEYFCPEAEHLSAAMFEAKERDQIAAFLEGRRTIMESPRVMAAMIRQGAHRG